MFSLMVKQVLFLLLIVILFIESRHQKIFAQSADTVTIVCTGDIMLGSNFPNNSYLPPDSGKSLLQAVNDLLGNATLTFGNLEGALLNDGGTSKKCEDMTKCYAFRMPEYMAKRLVEAGFDFVSIANNHSGDFGDAGRLNTQRTLNENNIKYAGLTSCPSVIFSANGVVYGFCAFSPFTGTQDILLYDTAKTIVHTLDSLCDIVIVSMHAGAEGATHRNVTRKTEIFYDEDRGNVYEFAHLMIDAGADLIIGHGPHVTRAVELYKGRFIMYSLGNFCTYARFNLKGSNGVAPIIKVYLSSSGEFIKAQVYSVKQIGEGITVTDPSNSALKEIIELTGFDFQEVQLEITNSGMIFKK